jgi:hypothetical protein
MTSLEAWAHISYDADGRLNNLASRIRRQKEPRWRRSPSLGGRIRSHRRSELRFRDLVTAGEKMQPFAELCVRAAGTGGAAAACAAAHLVAVSAGALAGHTRGLPAPASAVVTGGVARGYALTSSGLATTFGLTPPRRSTGEAGEVRAAPPGQARPGQAKPGTGTTDRSPSRTIRSTCEMPAGDAREHLGEVVGRARYAGQETTLTHYGSS